MNTTRRNAIRGGILAENWAKTRLLGVDRDLSDLSRDFPCTIHSPHLKVI